MVIEPPPPSQPDPPVAHDRRGALLADARVRAAGRRPAELLAQWRQDDTVAPSGVDQRTSVALDALALEAAPDYDALLLSPVAPLGTASRLAPTSQDRTLSTIRPTEVVSDPTNVLALEAARRLQEAPGRDARLCTVHQVLRMQAAPAGEGHTRHFRLFAIADAGRARPEHAFEVEAVIAQLRVHRRVLELAVERHGARCSAPRAVVRSDRAHDALGERTAVAIARAFSDVDVVRAATESAYYGGFRVEYGVHDADGSFVGLVDAGRFDWVALLTSDRRHRFVASAIGVQLLALLLPGAGAGSR
ncbi:hypothetical protein ACFPER_09210 [Agromyces aurantiacus]|uniref:Uncharacterized protein n=1 Tax=Agromyces aurantiacus TaxID=165814 RepID=A0ABV9R9E9_9MICO|nr:hypothetical protein [Agromyces aurantiacus]MBM7503650.1 hypothetical protein [Agromyces aurantiacus]